uniref:FP protein C-terminal domain-containing protein n=1 Tax=Nothobranchius korthausae TaxID=1143690 RepID=A0A1A8EKW8_9TELE
MEKDLDEVKKSLNFMSAELTKVVTQQSDLMKLIVEVQNLREIIKEKDKKIEELENRVEQLEQHARMEEVVISGLETTHRTYARAASGGNAGEDAPAEELLSLEKQVIQFFGSKGISIDSTTIAACYTIPKKQAKKQKTIIQFVSRKHKVDLLKVAKKLKGTGVYVNEHLTKKNAEIAWQARVLKKERKIQDTWIRNCKVMIKLNGPPEQAKVVSIRSLSELEKLK